MDIESDACAFVVVSLEAHSGFTGRRSLPTATQVREAQARKKISVRIVIKNLMKQVMKIKNLNKWMCRI